MKINFYLQDGRQPLTFIYLSAWFAGNKYQWTTGEKIKPRLWSKNTQRAKQGYFDSEFNPLLDKMEEQALSFFRSAKRDGRAPEKSEFTEYMNKTFLRTVEAPARRVDDLTSYIDLFVKRQEGIKKLSEGTIEHFRNLNKHLRNFAANKKGQKIPFKNVDLDFFYKFTEYLFSLPGRDGENMKTNTVSKQISKLKQIMDESREEGYHETTAYLSKKFRVKPKQFDRDYFSFAQLVQLYHCDLAKMYCEVAIIDLENEINSGKLSEHQEKIAFARIQAYKEYLETGEISDREKYFESIETLERIRDAYIVESFTGTRFSDFGKLKKEYFFEQDGFLCMRFRTKKSQFKVEAVVPIHPIVKSIFDRYNYRSPINMSNQKANKYVKEMLRIAGFDEKIYYYDDDGGQDVERYAPKWSLAHWHQTRNNFITNALDSGVSFTDVMNITGLKRVETVMRYYRGKKTESALRVAKSAFFAPDLFLKVV